MKKKFKNGYEVKIMNAEDKKPKPVKKNNHGKKSRSV